jgi:fatty acid desaturase
VDVTAERVRNPQEALAVTRRYPRRAYQIAAVLFLIAAAQAVIVVTAAGGESWLWGAAVVLAAGGVTAAFKSMPFENVTFPRA